MAKSPEGRLTHLESNKNRAILVGVYFSSKEKEECEQSLNELAALGDTYGLEVVQKIPVPLHHFESSTYLGKGKCEEIGALGQELHIDVVIFDEEIFPHQQRNLEKILGRSVIDRTELILGVFAQRARSREAKIQVELAACQYQLPRLTRLWTHLSRQKTGGGGKGGQLKGEGEKQIEIDKRILKRKVAELQKELEEVKKHREVQKSQRRRQPIPTFAIVGYTNVGKSTLLNALTNAGVLVENKLFATLDTTTRKYTLPNKQEILLVDTVGFIRKIPHSLVAAFKSTLEEALDADILIHLIDVSHPQALAQAAATTQVLSELSSLKNRPIITCLNKIDLCEDRKALLFFRMHYPKTIEISALTGEGFDQLFDSMMKEVSLLRKEVKLKIPQSNYALVSHLMNQGRVISCHYDEENHILLHMEIPSALEREVASFLVQDFDY
jgi:GTP-binding protein HflX